VGRGPARGEIEHHFDDTDDLDSLLSSERNQLSALVIDRSRLAHRPTGLVGLGAVMTSTRSFLLESAEMSPAGK